MNEIGKRINEYLVKKEISTKAAADQCGFTEDKLIKVMKGKRCIKCDDFMKICNGLSIPPSQFVRPNYVNDMTFERALEIKEKYFPDMSFESIFG